MVLVQDTQTRTKRKWGRIYFYLFIFFFYCLRICVQWHYTIGGLFSRENPPPRSLYNHDLAQHACFMAAFQASGFAWTIILRSFFFLPFSLTACSLFDVGRRWGCYASWSSVLFGFILFNFTWCSEGWDFIFILCKARSLELVFQGLNILLKNALYCRALLPVVISAPTHILSGSTLAFRS